MLLFLLLLIVFVRQLSCRFFFFKQKTAYEMRISDWSSDVCSSDLDRRQASPRCRRVHVGGAQVRPDERPDVDGRASGLETLRDRSGRRARWRSEEHTSELQSLMRISYAVFCLKKKKKKKY